METLSRENLKYRGFFQLERRRGSARFGYGGHAMCAGPAGTLFIAGHGISDLVARVRIPTEFDKRAKIVQEFFDPAAGLRDELSRYNLDTLGGIAVHDGELYSSWFRYYGVMPDIDDPTLAVVNSLGSEATRAELQHIGPETGKPFHQKYVAGYMDRASDSWLREAGIPDLKLVCGRGDGAGNASGPRRPICIAFNPKNPKVAKPLIYSPEPAEDYSPADEWTGMAFINTLVRGLVFVGRKDIAAPPSGFWYGQPDMPDQRPPWFLWNAKVTGDSWREAWREAGIVDRWRSGKGYHTTARQVEMRVYSLDEMQRVAQGILGSAAIKPVTSFALPEFHERSTVGACAFLPATNDLAIWEQWPVTHDGKAYPNEDPRVHIYHVEATTATDPIPPVPDVAYEVSFPGDPDTMRYDNSHEGRLRLINDVSDYRGDPE